MSLAQATTESNVLSNLSGIQIDTKPFYQIESNLFLKIKTFFKNNSISIIEIFKGVNVNVDENTSKITMTNISTKTLSTRGVTSRGLEGAQAPYKHSSLP